MSHPTHWLLAPLLAVTALSVAGCGEDEAPGDPLTGAGGAAGAAATGGQGGAPDGGTSGGGAAGSETGGTSGASGNAGSSGSGGGSSGSGGAAGSGADSGPAGSGGGSACPGLPANVDGTLVLHESFDAEPFANTADHLYHGSTVGLTTQIKRAGAGAAVFRVGDPQLTPEQCTSDRYRAEVTSDPVQGFAWDDGVSHWIGVSMNPTDFPRAAYTLFQIHAPNEPSGDPCDYAGNAISLVPSLDDGTMYYVLKVIEDGGQSSGTGAGSGQTEVWREPMEQDAWVDFVFNFSLSTKNQGYFHVFRNGEPVYSKTGLTNVNYIDSCGNLIPEGKRGHNGPHIGIYGPPCGAAAWMQEMAGPLHFREVVMDELRVATGPEGYLLVDPTQCGVFPPGYSP